MKVTKIILIGCAVSLFFINACKDKTTDPAPEPANNCASKSIVLTAAVTNATKCANDGKLLLSASGSAGFTYQLNNGAFQSDPSFMNLAAGSYTVTTKDADGCTKTVVFAVLETGTKGTNFSGVSAIVATKCQGGFCHTTGSGGAPVNILDTDCEIVERGALIKLKCVDGSMGNLNTTEKNKITAWLTAGGKYTD